MAGATAEAATAASAAAAAEAAGARAAAAAATEVTSEGVDGGGGEPRAPRPHSSNARESEPPHTSTAYLLTVLSCSARGLLPATGVVS